MGVTPDLIDKCFMIELEGTDPSRHVRLPCTRREVLDLQKKLSNAITDWMALSKLRVAELQEAQREG